jgi:3-oxoadipate enol-lactonase
MPYLGRTDGTQVYFETWGSGVGPWVTTINGHSRPLTDFQSLGRVLARNGFQTLAFDNRGAGQTVTHSPFLVDDIAEDAASLWDQLGITQSHVLGISFGGTISQCLAVRYPDRVLKLILTSTTPDSRYVTPEPVAEAKTESEIVTRLRTFFSPEFAKKNELFVAALIRETKKAFLDPNKQQGTQWQRQALVQFKRSGNLSQIQCPTLVVHGSQDLVIDFEAARLLAAQIPNAKLHELDGVGHLVLAECPKDFFEIVMGFLKDSSPADGS